MSRYFLSTIVDTVDLTHSLKNVLIHTLTRIIISRNIEALREMLLQKVKHNSQGYILFLVSACQLIRLQ